MAEQRSVFTPVDFSQQSPFSNFLDPSTPTPAQQQVAQTPAPLGNLGGIAMVASAFLSGATRGRIQKFAMEEQQKYQKMQALNSFMSQVATDPDITEDARRVAMQQYYQAIGGSILEVSGKGGKKGKEDDQQQGAPHHFANIMKDLATGMTGGKQLKGAPDPGETMSQIQAAIYGPDGKPLPQFSREGAIADVTGQIQNRIKSLPPGSTQEEANKSIADLYPSLVKVAGQQRADSLMGSYLGSYQRAPNLPSLPQVGSPAYVANELLEGIKKKGPQQQTGPSATPPPGPSGMPVAGVPSLSTPMAGSTPISGASRMPGQPPGVPVAESKPQYDSTKALLYQYAGLGNLGSKPQDITYTGMDGKEHNGSAIYVHNPEFQGWVDSVTNQPIQSKGDVRETSQTQPRAERFTTPKTVKGDPVKFPGTEKGKWYDVAQSLDNPDKRIVIGESAVPASARPRSTGSAVSAATLKFERQEKVYEAINKVVEQSLGGGMPADLSPADSAKWMRRNLQYYGKDKAVAPYMSEVIDWIEKQARTGTFKSSADLNAILGRASSQNQQDLKDSRNSDKVDALGSQVQDLTNDILGIAQEQKSGGSQYDEYEKP